MDESEVRTSWMPLAALVLAFAIASLVLVELTGGAASFRTIVEDAGVWAPAIYVLLKAATYVIAPLSGTSLRLAAGAMFGPWVGALLVIAADVLGGSINFAIARVLGRGAVRRFAGARALARIDGMTGRIGGWKALLLSRFVLSPVYDFVSYAAGLSPVRYATFVAVTAFGGIPSALAYAFFGYVAVESSAASVTAIAGLAIVLACMLVWKALRRRRRR